MKKAILILLVGLFWCNTSFAIKLSKCFAFDADEWTRDIISSEFEHEIYETREFSIDTNRGTISRYWRVKESVFKKRLKDPDWDHTRN